MTSPQALLVVDDTEAERQLIALTLGAAFPGAVVSRAADRAQAQAMCAADEFDCAILDYNMPEMNGVILAGELRAAFPYLPIILMTSFGDEMLAAEALRSGASDYIPKSRITAESMQRTIERSILASKQARLIDEQRDEIENFAYALAHDFKQPIRQIITFSGLIAEEIGAEDHAAIRQHLMFLGEAATRLARLVDVLLEYTLLNQPPELSDIDLNEVLSSVKSSLAPYLVERAAEFVAPVGSTMIRGNEVLLTQVLQNLVMNGLHYNRAKVPRVAVTAARDREHWTIEIADNGIGIDEQYLAEIFSPLIRLHTAAEFAGTGLGLTLARKAVVAQKGSIWCESTPGRGSVFHVRLPLAQADHDAKPPGQGADEPLAPASRGSAAAA